MEYVFKIPESTLEIKSERDNPVALISHGGLCADENTIYLYSFAKPNVEDKIKKYFEDKLWEGILEHEHLHAILDKFKVPVKYQDKIISAMGR